MNLNLLISKLKNVLQIIELIYNKQKLYLKKKKSIPKFFGFTPVKCNLVYISLVNNKIKNALLSHDNYKSNKYRKVSELNKKISSIVYSINELNNFCVQYDIQLYYFDLNENIFYIKNNNNFYSAELDLFVEKDRNLKIIFNPSFYEISLEKNKDNATLINNEYLKFKRKEKRKKEKFKYEIDAFNVSIIFDFANEYFNNTKINTYINFGKTHLYWKYYDISRKKAILCIQKNNYEEYEVKAFIYNNLLIEIDNINNFIIKETNNNLDKFYDYIFIISFDNLTEKGSKLLNISNYRNIKHTK